MSELSPNATSRELTREQIEGYRTLCVADIGILCDMALKCLRLNSFYSPTGESPDEWYEREKAAFRTWWEDEGEKTFSGTPTLAAGAGWFARAERDAITPSATTAALSSKDAALLPGLREALTWKPNTPQLENAMTYAWESAIKSFIRAIKAKS